MRTQHGSSMSARLAHFVASMSLCDSLYIVPSNPKQRHRLESISDPCTPGLHAPVEICK